MFGKDLFIKDNRYLLRKRPLDQFLLIPNPHSKTNIMSEIMILVNSILLSDPFYMFNAIKCGTIESLITCLFNLFLTCLSFYLLTLTWIDGRNISYSYLWTQSFGEGTKFILSILVLLSYLSTSSLLTSEIKNQILNLLYSSPNWTPPGVLTNKFFIIYVFTILPCIPTFIGLGLSSIKVISYIANISLFISAIGLLVQFIQRISQAGFDPAHQLSYFSNDWRSFFKSLDLFNSLFIGPIIPYTMLELKQPTVKRTFISFYGAIGISFFINLFFGYIGYLSFWTQEYDHTNILSFFPSDTAISIISRLGCLFSIIFSLNCYVHFIVKEITAIFVKQSLYYSVISDYIKQLLRVVCGLLVICFDAAVVVFDEEVYEWLQIIRKTGFSILTFIIPPLFFLKFFKFKSIPLAISSIFLITVSILTIVCNIYFFASE